MKRRAWKSHTPGVTVPTEGDGAMNDARGEDRGGGGGGVGDSDVKMKRWKIKEEEEEEEV